MKKLYVIEHERCFWGNDPPRAYWREKQAREFVAISCTVTADCRIGEYVRVEKKKGKK